MSIYDWCCSSFSSYRDSGAGIGVSVSGIEKTSFAQWYLIASLADWLVVVVVVVVVDPVNGELGASGTCGGISKMPDTGERGCGEEPGGRVRSYDRRGRGMRSLAGLLGSVLVSLEDGLRPRFIRPSRGASR